MVPPGARTEPSRRTRVGAENSTRPLGSTRTVLPAASSRSPAASGATSACGATEKVTLAAGRTSSVGTNGVENAAMDGPAGESAKAGGEVQQGDPWLDSGTRGDRQGLDVACRRHQPCGRRWRRGGSLAKPPCWKTPVPILNGVSPAVGSARWAVLNAGPLPATSTRFAPRVRRAALLEPDRPRAAGPLPVASAARGPSACRPMLPPRPSLRLPGAIQPGAAVGAQPHAITHARVRHPGQSPEPQSGRRR